jgi:soluble lytic murein transglycosylase
MMRLCRIALAALVVGAVISGRPEGLHYALAADETSSFTSAAVVLRPTDHPQVPRDLSEFWMVPDKGRVRTAAQANLATAIKFENDGDHARALALLTSPATKQEGPLATYVEYYKGLAELHLGRAADARATFRALRSKNPVGYLAEMAALREAECDEALHDDAAAIAVYEQLTLTKTMAPDEILMKLGLAAQAAGDADRARSAFERLYYEYPLSDLADAAQGALNGDQTPSTATRLKKDLARAERLFGAKMYGAAKSTFEKLRDASEGEDRMLIRLRVAECDYFLRRFRGAADALRPFVESGTRPAEALYYYGLAQRELNDNALFHTLLRRVVVEFPGTPWAEDALNSLALADARDDRDAEADQESLELFEGFPKGRYTERAAWRIGWRAYRTGNYAEAVRIFERAAFNFPRSDYRPAWLYWAGRSHEALNEPELAEARYSVEVIDYLNTYHGRLAMRKLGGRVPDRAAVIPARATSSSNEPGAFVTLPPNAALVKVLLTAKIYDDAADELRYAQRIWGDSGPVEATFAWTYREQGHAETGSRQMSLYRGSINAMKRAYPQFLTSGGERLPREILRIIYPIAYWDLIQKYSSQNGIDPFVVAALMAQESTFVANIRSPAKAVGLMQLVPPTARQYARRLGLVYSPKLLTTPESNIRIATAYLADQLRDFGELFLVLAAYNAGDGRVHRWMQERPDLPQEEFIDDIPFYETQGYVRKILSTAEDYRRLYGGQAGLASDDEMPSTVRTADASDVDLSLDTRKKPATPAAAKPEKPSPPAPTRAPAKKRKRAA